MFIMMRFIRPNFHVPESARILNKKKRFLGSAHGSSGNETIGRFSHQVKKELPKKQFFSLHSFLSMTSHRSSQPLFCLAILVIALPIPKTPSKFADFASTWKLGLNTKRFQKFNITSLTRIAYPIFKNEHKRGLSSLKQIQSLNFIIPSVI